MIVAPIFPGSNPGKSESTVDDFSIFDDSKHLFGWTDADPSEIIRFYLADAVEQAYPNSILESILCTAAPRFLSTVKTVEENPAEAVMARLGAVFHALFDIQTEDGVSGTFEGVCTLVCQDLDKPGDQSVWLDFTPGGDLDELEAALPSKLGERQTGLDDFAD